jgi:hypothetical protein
VNQIQDVRAQVDGLKRRLPENVSTKSVSSAATDLDQKLLAVRDDMIQMKIKANEDSLAFPPKVDGKLAFLFMTIDQSSDTAPTEAAYREFDKLQKQSNDFLARWDDLQRTDLASFQKLVANQNIQAIVVPAADGSTVTGGSQR